MAKHTPTPWKRDIGHLDGKPHILIIDSDDTEFTLAICGVPGNKRAEANADFLLTACNAHEELLALLRGWVETVDAHVRNERDDIIEDATTLASAAQALLAKIDGAA